MVERSIMGFNQIYCGWAMDLLDRKISLEKKKKLLTNFPIVRIFVTKH